MRRGHTRPNDFHAWVYSLGTEQSLSDGLPGEDGNAGKVMLDEPTSQLPFFEGAMALPPLNHIFDSCYKKRKGTERASGGPSLNLYTMAPDSKDLIEAQHVLADAMAVDCR